MDLIWLWCKPIASPTEDWVHRDGDNANNTSLKADSRTGKALAESTDDDALSEEQQQQQQRCSN